MINWKIFLTKNKYLLILIIAVVVLSLLPVFDIALMVQGAWQGVISTEIYADSQYYHSRLKEIQDGHLLMGNPYYIEHVNDFPPAFFFADWLAAIPLFLGFSLTTTLIADFILWSIIFCLLAYGFFWQAGFQKKWSAVSSFLVYLIVYIPMLRPVVFQVVFPVFLFILLSLAIWLKDPLSKKKIFLLAVAIALGFYTYTYLMQIVIVLVGLWLLFFLLAKKFNNFYGFLKIFLIALVLSVPFIFFMIKQTGAPYYWETMVRHALVYTHLPTANVVYSGKWVIFMLLLWLAGRLFVQKIKNDPQYNFYFNFFNILGAALLITSVSNVITGKEFEISMHIEYFIIVWLGLSFAVFLCFILKNIDIIRQIDFKRQIVLTVLSLACGAGALFYFWHYSPVVFLQEDRAVNKIMSGKSKLLPPRCAGWTSKQISRR